MRPLLGGVISDYEMTQRMLAQFFRKASRHGLFKPRVIVSVPSSITEVEERAVIGAAMEAGARRVYLIEEPLAAALGANLDIAGPGGHMVVDIGGGTTDVAVLSMNAVAVSSSTKVAGDAMDEAIMRYVRRKHGWFWEKIRPKRSKSPLVASIPGRKMPVCWSRAGTCAPAFPRRPPSRQRRFWRL